MSLLHEQPKAVQAKEWVWTRAPPIQVCSASARQRMIVSTGDPMETIGTLVRLVVGCVLFVEICSQFMIFGSWVFSAGQLKIISRIFRIAGISASRVHIAHLCRERV